MFGKTTTSSSGTSRSFGTALTSFTFVVGTFSVSTTKIVAVFRRAPRRADGRHDDPYGRLTNLRHLPRSHSVESGSHFTASREPAPPPSERRKGALRGRSPSRGAR